MTQSRLKDLLAQFLKGEEMGKYPVLETHILSLSPLQITDDFHRFIDLSSLEEEVTEELGGELGHGQKLILQDWKFMLRRIPNSHEYFFDLQVKRYQLEPDSVSVKPEQEPIKMEDDSEIRYLFETRKRAEIEKMVRGAKDAPSRDSGKSAAKPTPMTKEDSNMPSTKASEAKQLIESLNTQEFQKQLFLKPSTTKTTIEGKRSPVYHDSSFFRRAGVVSATSKFSPEEALYLSIAEIMSVPAFIPEVKRSVIRFMPAIRLRRSNSSESGYDELQRESISRMVQRYSQDRESMPRGRSELDFEDVHDMIRTGSIKWDQIQFSRQAFDYLKRNHKLLEQTD